MAVNEDDVRRAVALVADDLYVNGVEADIDEHEARRAPGEPEPAVRHDGSWDRYVYFLYVGEGTRSSSGFRYTGDQWTPLMVTDDTADELEDVLAEIRDAGDPPVQDKWNAAAITYERSSGTSKLHLFFGADAERWDLTPTNQARIVEQARALFDQPGVG